MLAPNSSLINYRCLLIFFELKGKIFVSSTTQQKERNILQCILQISKSSAEACFFLSVALGKRHRKYEKLFFILGKCVQFRTSPLRVDMVTTYLNMFRNLWKIYCTFTWKSLWLWAFQKLIFPLDLSLILLSMSPI